MEINLLPHQYDFCSDYTTRHIALIGGYGSGKTKALCYKTILMAAANPGYRGIVLEPVGHQLTNILLPEMDSILDELEIEYHFRASPYPKYYLEFEHGITEVLCASAENYKRLVGLNLAFAGVDEIDTVNKSIARDAWRKLQARLREGKVFQLYTTSTPEGFGFLYDYFVVEQDETKRIIHAKTSDNPFLPSGYIESLIAAYPQNLVKAYLDGQFVNLRTGQVYYAFDRKLNHTDKLLSDYPNHVLHIGMDFNVNKMSAIVHIVDNSIPYALDEIVGAKNTEHMITIINNRYTNRKIIIYPDATSKSQKTNASVSDVVLLRSAGYDVNVNSTNPRVKDRIASMNAMLCSGDNKRKYFINTKNCIAYCKALEQQAYDKFGDPDKEHDEDHPNDAGGYFIHKIFPLIKPALLHTH